MTNTFFDQANPPKYRGTFRVCGQCFTVVAASYWDRHVVRCNELEDLIEHPAALDIDDIRLDPTPEVELPSSVASEGGL